VILSILGLSNYPTEQSNMIGQAEPSTSAGKSDLPNTALVPNDFATRYHLAGVHGTGAGRTIGIVTLADVKPQVVADFWSSLAGLSGSQASVSRITPVDVDGGALTGEAVGSDETALDAEQSGALAPDANIRVYQAPNTDYGFVDAFFQAASDNVADSVSASWGSSETVVRYFTAAGAEDPNWQSSFDEAFLELAAQGQSTFLSSGDSGAYPASRDLGSTDFTAGSPDDSPWVTSSGGTTLPGSLTLHNITFNFPTERTWAWDYLWASPRPAQLGLTEEQYAEREVVGGGGGYSGYEAMPAYQRTVGAQNASTVEYLTPTAFTDPADTFGLSLPTDWIFNAAPSVARLHGNGRATPDLAADADPETGYLVLYTFGDSKDPNAPESIEQFGGTSFVAPQLNGSTAVIDSALGRRVGFWNPAIYKFATQSDSPFSPLDTAGTSNDNLLYTGTPGAIYNVGSGLGVPDFAQLAADFASAGSRR
jgi:subtilase family serine protease